MYIIKHKPSGFFLQSSDTFKSFLVKDIESATLFDSVDKSINFIKFDVEYIQSMISGISNIKNSSPGDFELVQVEINVLETIQVESFI